MKLNRNSIWYNLLIFPFKEHREYTTKTLCSLFWKIFFNTIVWFVIIPPASGVILAILSFIVISNYIAIIEFIIALIFGLIFLFILFIIVEKANDNKEKINENILIKYIKAKKQKICPLIEYNGERK